MMKGLPGAAASWMLQDGEAILTGDQLRAQSHQPTAARKRLGRIRSVSGTQAGIGLREPVPSLDDVRATVGKFVGIRCGQTRLIGVITDVSIQKLAIAREQGYAASAQVDLMGEIKTSATGTRFQRGVTDYPAIGDPADLLTRSELQVVYDLCDATTINTVHLQHDVSVGALVKVDEMLSKHFAILGTTGVGKSSGVVLILRAILEMRPDLRIFLVDPHNEYGQCFGERAQVLTPRNLKLPFWLFNFEETVDVIFGGRPGVDEEVEILSEVIPLAKSSYNQYRIGTAERLTVKKYDAKNAGFTADTPVPYRLPELVKPVEHRPGQLRDRPSR